MWIIDKAKMYIVEPQKAFRKEAKTGLSGALKYLLVMSLVSTILSTLFLALFSLSIPLSLFVAYMPAMYIGMIAAVLVSGLLLHIFAYLLGAKKGLRQTIKSVVYANTPSYLLSWIPVIGFIGSIWALVLEVLGLEELQKMKRSKAIMSVILSTIILAAIIVIIGMFLSHQ